jgi:hypothetical protein
MVSKIARIISIIRHFRAPKQLIIALFFAILSTFPYVLHSFQPGFQGLTVIRDKDYGNYESRLERALSGHPEEADNAITPVGSGIEGGQVAGMEVIVGTLFGWTGLRAPALAVGITPLFVFINVVLLFLLFRKLGFPERWALLGTALYVFILFHVIARVMHPGWSFVPAFAALLSFLHLWEKPTFLRGVLIGFLFALLPYLYFWHWTFVWATAGSALLIDIFAQGKESVVRKHPAPLVVAAALAILLAIPFALKTLETFSHPFAEQMTFRGGFLHTRMVESVPRSVLLLVQLGFFLSLFRTNADRWEYRAVLALLLGVFLALHQNILHGTLLMFSSHFEPHFTLVTLIVAGHVLLRPTPLFRRFIIVGITALFLAGAAKDYLPGYKFFFPGAFPQEAHLRDQHLAAPIVILSENGTRDVVLTDSDTGRVITAFTDEAILYTTHMRFLLISDEEMAERYCLSEELFSMDPPRSHRALYMEYNAVLDSSEMRAKEKELVDAACARVRADPEASLRQYGVTHVLWNFAIKERWNVTQHHFPLKVVAASESWALFELLPEKL